LYSKDAFAVAGIELQFLNKRPVRYPQPGDAFVDNLSMIDVLMNCSPEEIWAASLAMKSGITPVPPSRWDHGLYYDPRPRISDKTYCKVGAFLDFPISRNELGIPPQDFRSMTSATPSGSTARKPECQLPACKSFSGTPRPI
jgi:hypothetical protein